MLRMLSHYTWRPIRRAGSHYIFLMSSGVTGLIWSPPSLKTAAYITLPFYLTMGSLIVGGFLCILGRWRNTHTPKIFGLSMIMLSIFTYMLALLVRWPESAVNVFFLMAFLSLLADRMQQARRGRDARLAIRRGTATRSDLATYASDRLAGRRHDPRRVDRCPPPPGGFPQAARRTG